MKFFFLIIIGFIIIVLLNPIGMATFVISKISVLAKFFVLVYILIALLDL